MYFVILHIAYIIYSLFMMWICCIYCIANELCIINYLKLLYIICNVNIFSACLPAIVIRPMSTLQSRKKYVIFKWSFDHLVYRALGISMKISEKDICFSNLFPEYQSFILFFFFFSFFAVFFLAEFQRVLIITLCICVPSYSSDICLYFIFLIMFSYSDQ